MPYILYYAPFPYTYSHTTQKHDGQTKFPPWVFGPIFHLFSCLCALSPQMAFPVASSTVQKLSMAKQNKIGVDGKYCGLLQFRSLEKSARPLVPSGLFERLKWRDVGLLMRHLKVF